MRKLWISTANLRLAAGNKDRIDALAFAVIIKQNRINSLITNATQRKLKELFGIGADRVRKLIADGIRFGYLRREGRNLIANKLHSRHQLSVSITPKWFYDQINRDKDKKIAGFEKRLGRSLTRNERKEVEGKLTFIGARKIIQTAIIINHIAIQQSCEDTHNRTATCGNLAEYKVLKRKGSRMLRGGSYDERYRGMSNKKVQRLIGRKRKSASDSIRFGVVNDYFFCAYRIWYVLLNDPCNAMTADALEDSGIIVCPAQRSAFIRRSNVYRNSANYVSVTNHGK